MNKSFLLLATLILLCSSAVTSGNENVPQNVREVAPNWASQYYKGVIDQITPYYRADENISAWVFTIYRQSAPFPSSEEIKAFVAK